MNGDDRKNAILEKMQAAAAEHYAKAAGLPGDALSFGDLLTTILGITTSLLKGCGSTLPGGLSGAQQIKARASNPGLLQRMRVRNAVSAGLNEQYGPGGWVRHNGNAVVQTILAMGASATPEDILDAMSVND